MDVFLFSFAEVHNFVFEIGIGLWEDVLFEEFFIVGFGLDGCLEGSLNKKGTGSNLGGNKAISLLSRVVLFVF